VQALPVAFILIPDGRSLRPVRNGGYFVKAVDQNSPAHIFHFSYILIYTLNKTFPTEKERSQKGGRYLSPNVGELRSISIPDLGRYFSAYCITSQGCACYSLATCDSAAILMFFF